MTEPTDTKPPAPPTTEATEAKPKARPGLVLPAPNAIRPAWVKVPEGFSWPKGGGRIVYYMLCRANLTDVPGIGDRNIILWSNSDGDEKNAIARSLQDPNRVMAELAKQMIRSIDGHEVKWDGSGRDGDADIFWNEAGGRYRNQLQRLHSQLHTFNLEEQADFFENCFAAGMVG